MAEEKTYYLYAEGKRVEVSKEVYTFYYRIKRRKKTLEEKDQRNGVVSYNAMDTDELSGEETIPDLISPSVEETAIASVLYEKLHRCLELLPEPERELIQALYFEDLTERQLSKKSGVPQRTINDRKRRTLLKLKKLMEK